MPNGCGKCWEEFKGWLKAFTPIETLLTILEAILLVLLIVFIVFIILHFLSCNGQQDSVGPPHPVTQKSLISTIQILCKPSTTPQPDSTNNVTSVTTRPTCTYTPKGSDDSEDGSDIASQYKSEESSDDNSEDNSDSSAERTTSDDKTASIDVSTTVSAYDIMNGPPVPDIQKTLMDHMTDGELANEDEKRVLLALVRIKPSGLTFGCILTVVSERWTVTAASCLDSIEEVDSLDNFVIIDNYDEPNKGRSHAVSDVRVHPLFAGSNKSYDLALLRSEGDLGREPVRLPSLLDYFKLTVGEAVKILGFGPFRTIDSQNKRVHSAFVHILPMKHCTPAESVERHLVPLEPVTHGRCGVGPVCGGVLYARGTPCNYCAGAPLVRARALLGVMADHEQCGAACEPALHANIAAARDWIEQVIAN